MCRRVTLLYDKERSKGMGMKQPKDYVTKEERVVYTFKEKLRFWWKWKGQDLLALITFFVLILMLSSIDTF